tara:strand:- start:4201 stop:6240 length:2040 start_codon:yes stop_codon:yes gene_type:complete
MSLGVTVIQDLAIVLILAFIAAAFFARKNQPVILSYLLVGALIGPSALKIISNLEIINLFADLGIILLMFSIGLEFNLNRLKPVGAVAVFAGGLEVLFMLGIGNTIGKILGWSSTDSLFLGGILAISSTAIIAKFLKDMKSLNTEYAPIIIGILIVQDIAAIILLTFFGGVASLTTFNLENVILTIFNIFLFFLITLPIGIRFMPKIISWIKLRIGSNEILLLTSLGFCFSLAIFSNNRGFSLALGAFMAGVILAEAQNCYEIRGMIRPIRDMFTTIFFVSIGMLLDLVILRDNFLIALFLFFIIVFGRILSCGLATYLSGYGGRISMYVGVGLIPLGEFSLIMAKQGYDTGLINPALYQITIATTILSIAATPFLFKSIPTLTKTIDRTIPRDIKNFIKYLASWVILASRLLQFNTSVAKDFKDKFIDIVVNILVIVTVWILIFSVANYVPELPIKFIDINTTSTIVAIIVSLPSMYLILRRIQGLIELFLKILGEKFSIFDLPQARNTIRNVSFIFIGLIIVINVFPIIMLGISGYNYVIIAFLFLIIAFGVYLFWHTITRFQVEMEGMIRKIMLPNTKNTENQDSNRRMMMSIFEGIMKNKIMDQIEINEKSPVIGKSIADTKLRTRTGTTIIGIERANEMINNPRPKTLLLLGDKVTLVGDPEERDGAKKILIGQ